MAPATFFAHFPAKEDLVFGDHPKRAAAMRTLISNRPPGEPLRALLLRGVDLLEVSGHWPAHQDDELVAIRASLVSTVPALRAAALRRIFDIQPEWADALAEAFPDELDELDAHAVIGSLVGAVISVALANVRRGEDALPMPEAVTRAAESVLSGLPQAIPNGHVYMVIWGHGPAVARVHRIRSAHCPAVARVHLDHSRPWNAAPRHRRSGISRSCLREVIPSLRKMLRRCASTVRGLRNSRPATSFDVAPAAT